MPLPPDAKANQQSGKRMNLHRKILVLLASALVAQAAHATTEVLYITNGDASTIQAIQGNAIITQNLAMPGTLHYAIAVRDTIWTASYGVGGNRQEFATATLLPTANNGAFTAPAGNPEILDGATDGAFNYTINDGTGEVLRYNLDWSGAPVTVFTAVCGGGFCPGITYDPVNQSLWVADSTNISEYAMDGTPLGSFAHGDDAGALAFETSTNSLWLVSNSPNNTLRQFSRAGALLNTIVTAANYSGNVWGAEFRSFAGPATQVPTLSEWGLLVLSLLSGLGAWVALRRGSGRMAA
jgi:hypothetical protein